MLALTTASTKLYLSTKPNVSSSSGCARCAAPLALVSHAGGSHDACTAIQCGISLEKMHEC